MMQVHLSASNHNRVTKPIRLFKQSSGTDKRMTNFHLAIVGSVQPGMHWTISYDSSFYRRQGAGGALTDRSYYTLHVFALQRVWER